jgi:hypothetical protein
MMLVVAGCEKTPGVALFQKSRTSGHRNCSPVRTFFAIVLELSDQPA